MQFRKHVIMTTIISNLTTVTFANLVQLLLRYIDWYNRNAQPKSTYLEIGSKFIYFTDSVSFLWCHEFPKWEIQAHILPYFNVISQSLGRVLFMNITLYDVFILCCTILKSSRYCDSNTRAALSTWVLPMVRYVIGGATCITCCRSLTFWAFWG